MLLHDDEEMTGDEQLAAALNVLANDIHDDSVSAGWWDDGDDKYVLATKLMLVVSEVAEAMEGLRKDQWDDHLPHRKMVEVEVADALIRLLDFAGALNMDIGGAVMEKLEYNRNRLDHKQETRQAAGGKQF